MLLLTVSLSKTSCIYKWRFYINSLGIENCMLQPNILITELGIYTQAEAEEQEKTVLFLVEELQFCYSPFEYLWYKLSVSFVLSNNWFHLQKNKWEFFMFLILEVSAMIITGATAIISMYTSFFVCLIVRKISLSSSFLWGQES